MTGKSSRIDVKDNSPDDLKAIDLSTYNSDLTTTLTSKNSETRPFGTKLPIQEAWWTEVLDYLVRFGGPRCGRKMRGH